MPSDRKNSLWLSIQYVILLVSSVITLKLNLAHYGPIIFGIWILLRSVWGIGSVLDFGFGTSVLKYVAEYKDDKKEINKILSSSLVVFVLIGFVIFLVGNLCAYVIYVNDLNIVPIKMKGVFALVSFLLGVSFVLQYLASFFQSVINGLNNFVYTSKISIIQIFLSLSGIILISILDMNIIILALLYIMTALFLFVSYLSFFLFKLKTYKISFREFKLSEIKRIISFSLSVQTMSIFNALIDPIIKYFLGNYYNIGSVSSYEIARRFAVAISGLFFNAFKIVLPKASSLKLNSERIAFLRSEIVKYCNLGIIYSGFAFGVFSLPIILLIMIIFRSEEAALIFIILALPESINNFGYSIYNFLLGIGKAKFLVFIQLNNLLFVIFSMLIGFVAFHNILGLLGYFLSVSIANILMLHYINIKIAPYVKQIFIHSKTNKLILLVAFMILSLLMLYFHLITLYAIFTLLSIISLVIFGPDMKKIYSQILIPILKNRFVE